MVAAARVGREGKCQGQGQGWSRVASCWGLLIGLMILLGALSPWVDAADLEPGVCGPSALGAPCPQEGPASLAQYRGAPLGLGNPVHLGTGRKYQRDTDFLQAESLGLEVVRHYNSADPRDVGLGAGWRLSYDTRLYAVGAHWQIVQADGVRWHFAPPQAPGQACQVLAGDASEAGELWPQPGGTFRWQWPSGRVLNFDQQGLLQGIEEPGGARVTLSWGSVLGQPRLLAVRDSYGRQLRLEYEQGQLRRIHTPAGVVHYVHAEHGALRAVLTPPGEGRVYVYEPAYQGSAGESSEPAGVAAAARLTGVFAWRQGWLRRLWAWDYNARGQVVEVHGGERGVAPRATLHYDSVAGAPGRGPVALEAGGQRWPLSIEPAAGTANPLSVASAQTEFLARSLPSWPGLQWRSSGGTLEWQADEVGSQRWHWETGPHAQGRETRLHWEFANGDHWQLGFDEQGRLSEWQRWSARLGQGDQVVLSYLKDAGLSLHHPRETRHYRPETTNGGLAEAGAQPPTPWKTRVYVQRAAMANMPAWEYEEQIWRNAAGQVVRHDLPEGGRLDYLHDEAGELQEIQWQPLQGARRVLWQKLARGWRLANGTQAHAWQHGPAVGAIGADSWLWHAQGKRLLLAHQRQTDERGLVVSEAMRVAGSTPRWQSLQYDAQARLVGQHGTRQWQAWQWAPTGARLAQAREGETGLAASLPPLVRDPSGLPQQWQGWRLEYGADRRLARAWKGGVQVRYFYNALGELIGRTAPGEAAQYLYHGHQRVAEWRGGSGGPGRIEQRFVYADEVPVALLQRKQSVVAAQRERFEVWTVHADAMGQPLALSDDTGRLRWSAEFGVWGEPGPARGTGDPGWRWPGQWQDPLLGWHLNHQRIYLPERGQYLEPELLGPAVVPPGRGLASSPFGYAAQQPRRWLDPTGLVLFAFDGTLQDQHHAGNVVRFFERYRDAQAQQRGLPQGYYLSGPGSEGWLDAALAHSAEQRIQQQWQSLLQHVMALGAGADPVMIDLVGYSRGAAMARDFASRVAAEVRQGRFWTWDQQLGAITQCVDLRFIGLFDSVAQFGVLGSADGQFDFTLDPAWQWVAHAVALHERRQWFPLLSLTDPVTGLPTNAIEQGFIGSHADIGGGLAGAVLQEGEAALADVALEWLLAQAQQVGVLLEEGALGAGDWAWLHDDRTPYQRLQGWQHDQAAGKPVPGVYPADRAVLDASGQSWLAYQGLHESWGQGARLSSEAVLQRTADWLWASGRRVAQVSLVEYERWRALHH